MQTAFTEEQLKDPQIARSNEVLRSCVHCGFCTATCPTYQILGDENDSPRGRIYLIKQMLEQGRPADPQTVKHIDRCLSCLACMTTCPSGVHYMHLVDHAREHIEKTYRRPLMDRLMRRMLAETVPYPNRFRFALLGAKLGRPFAALMPARVAAMLKLAPGRIEGPTAESSPGVFPAEGERTHRVAMLAGCAQQALDAEINRATIRLLNRHGVEVVIAEGAGCCGALVHHLGMAERGHAFAAANIRAWTKEMDGKGLDAIVINASGCGTTIKDYGHMFRTDPALAGDAERVAKAALDITEFMAKLDLRNLAKKRHRVAYHSACSMQHGQRVTTQPKALLKEAGFEVVTPRDSHLCCGSAGVYNVLQPKLAGELQRRKVSTIEALAPEMVATGNIGCITQIRAGTELPVLHTVQLLDWATGGPVPPALRH